MVLLFKNQTIMFQLESLDVFFVTQPFVVDLLFLCILSEISGVQAAG